MTKTVSRKAIVDHIEGCMETVDRGGVLKELEVKFYGHDEHLEFMKTIEMEGMLTTYDWTGEDDSVFINIETAYAPTNFLSAAYTVSNLLTALKIPAEDMDLTINQLTPYDSGNEESTKGYFSITIDLMGYRLEE